MLRSGTDATVPVVSSPRISDIIRFQLSNFVQLGSTGTNRSALRFMIAGARLSMTRIVRVLRPAGMRRRPKASHGDSDVQPPLFQTRASISSLATRAPYRLSEESPGQP